jgi:antitoxin VapB
MAEERAEWQGKTFKSGNSVALRLPKGLGVPDGVEVTMVREAPMTFRVQPVDAPKRKFNIAKVAGSAKTLRYIQPEDRVFEDRPLLWDDPDWRAKYMPGE